MDGIHYNQIYALIFISVHSKLKDFVGEGERRKEAIIDLKQRNTDLEAKLALASGEADKSSNNVAKMQEEIDNLKFLIKERDENIERLIKEHEVVKGNLADEHNLKMATMQGEKDQEIKDITLEKERNTEEKDFIISNNTKTIAERDEQIDKLALEIQDLTSKIQEL